MDDLQRFGGLLLLGILNLVGAVVVYAGGLSFYSNLVFEHRLSYAALIADGVIVEGESAAVREEVEGRLLEGVEQRTWRWFGMIALGLGTQGMILVIMAWLSPSHRVQPERST